MWGSSSRLKLVGSTTFAQQFSGQLAQVTLPEPAVCSFYLQAAITSQTNALTTVGSLTINLLQGIGRVTVPRSLTFMGQPAPGAPLELTIPFVPLHSVQVDMVGIMGGPFNPGDELTIEAYFVLAPITKVGGDKAGVPLEFGMALPGEADGLDDSMHDEVEEEHPGTIEVMRARLTEPGDDDEHDDPREVFRGKLSKLLREKLGRNPTPLEIRRTMRKLAERQRLRRASESP